MNHSASSFSSASSSSSASHGEQPTKAGVQGTSESSSVFGVTNFARKRFRGDDPSEPSELSEKSSTLVRASKEELQPEMIQEMSMISRKAMGVTHEIFFVKLPDADLGCEKICLAEFLQKLEDAADEEDIDRTDERKNKTQGRNEKEEEEKREEEDEDEEKKREKMIVDEEKEREERKEFSDKDVLLIDSKNFPGSTEFIFAKNGASCIAQQL